jgi:hypothetical protein
MLVFEMIVEAIDIGTLSEHYPGFEYKCGQHGENAVPVCG